MQDIVSSYQVEDVRSLECSGFDGMRTDWYKLGITCLYMPIIEGLSKLLLLLVVEK
jgi:hypothetical protein